jgi:hypothetical protein
MTLGDKWATAITLSCGIAISYVLQMHNEGREIVPRSIFSEFQKFNAIDMRNSLLQYEDSIKKEVI